MSCLECFNHRPLFYFDDDGQEIEVGIFCLKYDDIISGGDSRNDKCPKFKLHPEADVQEVDGNGSE